MLYHPDQAIEKRLEQEAQVRALYDAVQTSGHELLLEIIAPKQLPCAPDTVLRALKRFYNLGVYPEWWKLEPMDADQWRGIDALIAERDPYCRGVLVLGLGASVDALSHAFGHAAAAQTCRGFAVGRTIFEAPARDWLADRIDDDRLVSRVRDTYLTLVDAWRTARAAAHRRTQAA